MTDKKALRAAREAKLADATKAAASKIGVDIYGVIYADPPWKFANYSEKGMDRSAENHYPTMTLADIKSLQVPAAPNCVLFMWATVPMLVEALVVSHAWGFKYKSHLMWDKGVMGTGYWSRNQHELLLICTKGRPVAPALGTQSSSVHTEMRTAHSRKPEFYSTLIESLFPAARKLEMFARQARKGWDAWGNEAPLLVVDKHNTSDYKVTTQETNMDLNKVTSVYIKIRDARSALKKEFDAKDNELKEKLTRLEGEMLKSLQEAGATSIATTSGTVYKQEEITPTGSDWQAFYDWVRENNAFDALERRIKKTFVKEHMEANGGELPPGVSVYREFVVRVRRS